MCKSFVLGNKKFIFRNLMVYNMGEYRSWFTMLLLIIPTNVFLGLESTMDFDTNNQYILIGIFIFLQIINLYFFLKSTYIDPGIVLLPIQTQDKTESNLKIIEYQNRTFVLKFCQSCQVFRPLRAHHCRLCDLCIEELDHHCPWISNCVGRRNRKYFVFLTFFASILCGLILVLSIYKFVVNLSDLSTFRFVELIIFIIISSAVGISVLLLFFLQIFLICKGLTTNEYLRGTFLNVDNPFNKGMCTNMKEFLTNDTSQRNINMAYLMDKEKFDNHMQINKKGEDNRNSEFSLEMNMFKTLELLKSDEASVRTDDESFNANINKKLINEQHAI